MSDLLISAFVMTAICIVAARIGIWLQQHTSPGRVLCSELMILGAMVVYLTVLWDKPLLTVLIPFPSAIILGNWLPVLGALILGICIATRQISLVRRIVLAVCLCVIGGYSLIRPLLGEVPICSASDPNRILNFQTTDQTCSAACAAGLLRLHGIDATEGEMAELCLTRKGTHWLGVFRGLKLKTAGTEWDVVVEEVSRDDLLRRTDLEGVLALTFTRESARYSEESGFGTDMGHTVLSMGTDFRNTLTVFDPSPDFGFESWNSRILADVSKGILLRLVSRNGTPCPLRTIDRHRPSTWNETGLLASLQVRNTR
jgi:hypothetical protein